MKAADVARIAFGDFEFCPATLELWCAGAAVHLQPRPSRALELLVRQSGSLVTREALQQHVWPDTVVELDQGLNTCIRQLRAALGDDSDAPRFIETVPRRGYRFIAPVRPVANRISDPALAVGTRAKPGARGIAFGLAIVVGLLGVWLVRRPPSTPRPIRLAVLPLETIGGDEWDSIFTDGLSEELITTLAGLDPETIVVVARASSARFGYGSHSVKEIGDALDVDYYLEGSARASAGAYRISARLVRVSDESTIWSEQYDRTAEQPISAQEWLASRVSNAIAPKLASGHPAVQNAEPVPAARTLWLMARHLLNRLDSTEAERSVPLLNDVLDLHPTFAPAHVSLGRAFLRMNRLADAEAAVRTALELDPDLPEAYFIRGQLRLRQWKLDEAGQDFSAAAVAAMSDSRVHDYFAYYLAVVGRHDEARTQMLWAKDIDPISSAIFVDGGLFHYWAGNLDDAVRDCEQALQVALPQYRVRAHRCLVHAYEAAGEIDRAREHALAILELGGAGDKTQRSVADSGDSRAALRTYWVWAARDENLHVSQGSTSAYAHARAAAALGDFDATIRFLDQAVENRDASLIQVSVEPRFESLRDDPRFRAVVEAVGVPGPA